MRIVFDIGPNFATFLAARLVFLTVLLGAAALFRGDRCAPWVCLLLFAANALLSLGCWEWSRRHRLSLALRTTALTAAVILDTLVLYASGGAQSEFIFLYFFSIASAGLLVGLSGSLWTAFLSAAGLLWLFAQETPGYLSAHLLRWSLLSVNFLLTAVLMSFLYRRLREREARHLTTLGELERTRLDTQAILDSLSTGVLVIDTQRRVRFFNPAARAVMALPPSEDEGDWQPHLLPGTPLGSALDAAATRREPEITMDFELACGAETKPVRITLSRLRDREGRERGCILLLSDLTRAREMERAARERDQLAAIGKLSRDLAHEIRNPLATVRGCVEMIRTAAEGEPEQAAFRDLALRESDRLNNLLRDFLAFAHLEPPRKRPADLHALIRERAACADGLSVQIALAGTRLADCDPEQLALVVDTLLLTLAEWNETANPVRIEPGASPRAIRFLLPYVTIPTDVKAEAFRPFAGVLKHVNSLALPTALRIVHAHEGNLFLQTEPGTGTWFELVL